MRRWAEATVDPQPSSRSIEGRLSGGNSLAFGAAPNNVDQCSEGLRTRIAVHTKAGGSLKRLDGPRRFRAEFAIDSDLVAVRAKEVLEGTDGGRRRTRASKGAAAESADSTGGESDGGLELDTK